MIWMIDSNFDIVALKEISEKNSVSLSSC